jgi:hypothetical protein
MLFVVNCRKKLRRAKKITIIEKAIRAEIIIGLLPGSHHPDQCRS